jgi:hypothetical protein
MTDEASNITSAADIIRMLAGLVKEPTAENCLTIWQSQIAKAATNGGGLATFQAACVDMAQRVPVGNPFRDTVLDTLQRCVESHLAEHHNLEAVGPILYAAFPELVVRDDNAELDAVAIEASEHADIDAEIKRLARLGLKDYEREREAAAKKLDVRVGVLDKLVKAECGASNDTKGQGRPIEFAAIEPWPDAVDGAVLLTELATAIASYVIVSSSQADALGLWSVYAHAYDAFDVAPKLILKSAQKRSGKTRLVSVLARVVTKPLFTSSITPAALMRVIELYSPTLLLDEVDASKRKNPEMAQALRGLINSAFDRAGAHHTLNAPLPGGGYEPRNFSTWAPMVLSGIGDLPDTVRDRSIEIELIRKRPDETVKRLRRRDGSDLDILARKIRRWVSDIIEKLGTAVPVIPVGLDDRAADAWEPLIAIADAAGGIWLDRARRVAVELSGDGTGREDDSIGIRLLADINGAFGERKATQMATADLIENLIAIEGHSWAEWKGGKPITPTGLDRLLAPFHTHRFTFTPQPSV